MDKTKHFCFVRSWGTLRNGRCCCTLLAGCELVHPLRIPEVVPLKMTKAQYYSPVIPFLRINSREMFTCAHKEVPLRILTTALAYNRMRYEIMQMPSIRGTAKQPVAHSHYGVLYGI